MPHLRLPSIDRRMLPAKAYYLTAFASMAALTPFLPLYYRQLGLDGQQIGLLQSFAPLITLMGAPLWAALADVTGKHRRLLILAMVGGIISTLGLSVTSSFLLLMMAVGLRALFGSPVTSLVDSSVLHMLGDRKELYGRQRLWGAVGWSLASLAVGILADHWGLMWAFYIYLALSLLALLAVMRLPISKARLQMSYGRGLRMLLRDDRWARFLVPIFVAGLGSSAGFGFLFLHLADLGATTTLMGFSLTVGSLSELPAFFFSGALTRRWGAKGPIMLAMLSSMVRLLVFSSMKTPALVLPLQILQGPAFAALWAGGVAYAQELAPPGMETSAQALFGAVSMGLTPMFGAALGGIVYQRYGGGMLFLAGALTVALGLVLFVLATRGLTVGKVERNDQSPTS